MAMLRAQAFSGPHPTSYLPGFCADGAHPHMSLNEALVCCFNDPNACGVTKSPFEQNKVAFTVRSGNELMPSHDQTSWLKLAESEHRRSYTAVPFYWNVKLLKDGSQGKWIDGTPSEYRDRVLIESKLVRVKKEAVQQESKKLHPLYVGAEDLWYLNPSHRGLLTDSRQSNHTKVRIILPPAFLSQLLRPEPLHMSLLAIPRLPCRPMGMSQQTKKKSLN